MSSVFFLSYASPDKDDHAHRDALDRFWISLASKVAELVQLPAGSEFSSVGFRDSQKLMAGTPDWRGAGCWNCQRLDLRRGEASSPCGRVVARGS